MLGIGCGFDGRGANRFEVFQPKGEASEYTIPDTREGWVESVRWLLNSYLIRGRRPIQFDYRLIRPAGTPIKTFGGTAAGAEPLKRLHHQIHRVLRGEVGKLLGMVAIADIGNLIGVCVVSGNVRRSAEIFLGDLKDEAFLNLKNPKVFPERNAYA